MSRLRTLIRVDIRIDQRWAIGAAPDLVFRPQRRDASEAERVTRLPVQKDPGGDVLLPTTSLTGSLVTVALIASCSPATQQPTSSDSAAASSASGIRIVKDSGGKDVEIPADVTRVAPTIGAFSAVTAMLGASGKITAAATSALSPRFKATYPEAYS